MGGSEKQALILADELSKKYKARVLILGSLSDKSGTLFTQQCDNRNISWREISLPPLFRAWNSPYYAILVFIKNVFTKRKNKKIPAKTWVPKIFYLHRFLTTLRATNPDVIIPFTTLPNILCGLCWRMTRTRICIWNQRDEGLGLHNKWIEKLAVALTPVFISNSVHAAAFLSRRYGVSSSIIQIIHNAVEITNINTNRSTQKKELNIEHNTFTACMVANIHGYKDHETLIKAWGLVIDELDREKISALLILAGNRGNAFSDLEILIKNLGLSEEIRCLGLVEDISSLLNAVDIGVFSSKTEGIPNAVLESMAAGLPVVGTDIPGIREAVGEEGVMYLAPPGDYVKLAEIIVHLANNPKEAEEIGLGNIKRIREHFNREQIFEHLTNLICISLEKTERSKSSS